MDVEPTPISLEHFGEIVHGEWFVRDSWMIVQCEGKEARRLVFGHQHHLEELAQQMMVAVLMGW
jgi:hypothetical protein